MNFQTSKDLVGEFSYNRSYLQALISGSNLTASLVVDENGDTVDEHGGSKLLGGPIDKLWLGVLRQNAQIVLTSGETFRAESYRMPRNASLAIATKKGVDIGSLSPSAGQQVVILSDFEDLADCLPYLRGLGYRRIHTEFGEHGVQRLARTPELKLFLSSLSHAGIRKYAERHSVSFTELTSIDGLMLAVVN